MITADELVEKLKDALKKFGTYSFDDKGPGEVMHIAPITAKLKAMSAEDAAKVILELSVRKECEGRCHALAEYLVLALDDWDELFDIDGIPELYG